MKKITCFLSKINAKSYFLGFLLIIFFNKSFSQLDLRTCGYNCNSNNYTLKDVFLSLTDVYGVSISNSTCTPGTVKSVYILMNYTSNANANIYYTRLFADLSINGVSSPINVLLGTVTSGNGQRKIYGPFNWICGDEFGDIV